MRFCRMYSLKNNMTRFCEDETEDMSTGEVIFVAVFLMLIVVAGVIFAAEIMNAVPASWSNFCYYERPTGYESVIGEDTVYQRHFVDCPKDSR